MSNITCVTKWMNIQTETETLTCMREPSIHCPRGTTQQACGILHIQFHLHVDDYI